MNQVSIDELEVVIPERSLGVQSDLEFTQDCVILAVSADMNVASSFTE